MRISVGLIALGSALIFCTSAFAATVTAENGEVLVNRGAGYKPVRQPTEVTAGDQVMAKPKSSGRVVFPDGCTVSVPPGAVLTIQPTSPCERSAKHVETAGSTAPNAVTQPPQNDGSYVIGAVLAAGAAVEVVWQLKKDKPASP